MLGPQSLKQFLNRWTKSLVRCYLGYPAGITARGRDLQESEDGDAGWLVLVRDIGMVAGCGQAGRFALSAVEVVGAEVDVVELNMILNMRSNGL